MNKLSLSLASVLFLSAAAGQASASDVKTVAGDSAQTIASLTNTSQSPSIASPVSPRLVAQAKKASSSSSLKEAKLDFVSGDYGNNYKIGVSPSLTFQLQDKSRLVFSTGWMKYNGGKGIPEVSEYPVELKWIKQINDKTRFTLGGGVAFHSNANTSAIFNTGITYRQPLKMDGKKVLSFIQLGANVDYGAYASNAKTLNGNVTVWNFRPNLLWQIAPETRLKTGLGFATYSDNPSQFSTSFALEQDFAKYFTIAAKANTTSFSGDSKFYGTPQSSLTYGGELGVRGPLTDNLTCGASVFYGKREVYNSPAALRTGTSSNYGVSCEVSADKNWTFSLGYRYGKNDDDNDFKVPTTTSTITSFIRYRF